MAVLGAAYRGGVKETAFSGVFPLVEALASYGAQPRVHDPPYDDDELAAFGFAPYHLGEPCCKPTTPNTNNSATPTSPGPR